MAIYVYVTNTGALYSYCPNDTDPVAPLATLQKNGLTAVSGLPQLSPTVAWNPASKTTQAVVPVAVSAPPVSGSIVFNGVTYSVSGTTI